MHADHAVIHLAPAAEPLPPDADGMLAALGGSRFINAADRLGVGVFAGNQLLTLIADTAFSPLDRFQQTL